MGLDLQSSSVYDCVWVLGTCLEVSDLTEPKAVQKTQRVMDWFGRTVPYCACRLWVNADWGRAWFDPKSNLIMFQNHGLCCMSRKIHKPVCNFSLRLEDFPQIENIAAEACGGWRAQVYSQNQIITFIAVCSCVLFFFWWTLRFILLNFWRNCRTVLNWSCSQTAKIGNYTGGIRAIHRWYQGHRFCILDRCSQQVRI